MVATRTWVLAVVLSGCAYHLAEAREPLAAGDAGPGVLEAHTEAGPTTDGGPADAGTDARLEPDVRDAAVDAAEDRPDDAQPPQGTNGGPCFDGGACAPTLCCFAGVCRPFGTRGLPCCGGECYESLACVAGVCGGV